MGIPRSEAFLSFPVSFPPLTATMTPVVFFDTEDVTFLPRSPISSSSFFVRNAQLFSDFVFSLNKVIFRLN